MVNAVSGLRRHDHSSNGQGGVISGAAGYRGTSGTSLAIATGSKAFTTQAGLAYVVGSRLRAASDADPADFMEGIVTAYTGTTLTVLVDLTGGTGTDADWNLSIAGEQGVQGAGVPPEVVQHGNCGSTETFDYGDGNYVAALSGASHKGTVNADLTVTLATSTASGTLATMEVRLIGDGTHTVSSWAGTIAWEDGVAPTFDSSLGAINRFLFESDDAGTVWLGLKTGPGPAGAAGADGISGGAVSIPYTFSTTTTDSDPGNGNLRLSNAIQNIATVIRADLLASDTTDWSAVLATLADSTNTVKGHIRLYLTADPTKWLLFTVSAVASPSGYKNITVANVGSSASSPFANADPITLSFTRAGDVGAAGTASVGSDPIWDAAGDLAVGTGADTAAKLTKGADSTVLTIDPSTHLPVWAAPAGGSFVGCRVYNNASQTVSANTETTMLYNTDEYDTSALHDTGSNTGRITVSATGYWRFTAGIYNPTTGSSYNYFRVDGSTPIIGSEEDSDLSIQTPIITATVHLTSGQYVEVRNYGPGTGRGSATAQLSNFFEAQFLGA